MQTHMHRYKHTRARRPHPNAQILALDHRVRCGVATYLPTSTPLTYMLRVHVCGVGNEIPAAGATALADAIKVNTTLQQLHLGGTCVRGDPIRYDRRAHVCLYLCMCVCMYVRLHVLIYV